MSIQLTGLTLQQVQERKSKGQQNTSSETISQSNWKILRRNLFTLFNFLNFAIAALLFHVEAYSNMIFIAVICLNIFIGTFQEIKAKKLIANLSILNLPRIRVLRQSQIYELFPEDLVKDDLMILQSGDQICCDCIIQEGTVEVNESLLTGESDGIFKSPNDILYSGSYIIAGKAYACVTHLGLENYASHLANQVKKEKQMHSELIDSMKKVTGFTSLFIIPVGILLFMEALYLRNVDLKEAVVSSSAALLGMLPKGLMLLISVSLAAGVIRLGKLKILVQNIYSLETLAHVDVLCLDKTGTITNGTMKTVSIHSLSSFSQKTQQKLIASYLRPSDDNNATAQALKESFSSEDIYTALYSIPFSSQRKWGAVIFSDKNTVFLGAPERLIHPLPSWIQNSMKEGYRAVAFGYYRGIWKDNTCLPSQISPLCCVFLEDSLRPHTEKTLQYFRKEGVDIKIISGDHLNTVCGIARKAGLSSWNNAIDLSCLKDPIDYSHICETYSVFTRVTPIQKKELVKALKSHGHRVAMTGDGINDLLALKEADCSIAVSDGSQASRQLSQIVLLNSDFSNLPQVVLEGRQVIHNVTRTASVFFVKTLYSVLVSIFCLLFNLPFPFIPIQITLIDACIEAYPAFFTILEPDPSPIQGSFLKKVLGKAFPFGTVITAMIIFTTATAPFHLYQKQTLMYFSLIFISMAAVVKSCIPFTKLRFFLCFTMFAGTLGILWLIPWMFQLTFISLPMAVYWILTFWGSLVLLFVLNSLYDTATM